MANLSGGASVSRRCLPCSRRTCGDFLCVAALPPCAVGIRLWSWASTTVRRWVERQLCLRHSLRPGESRGQLLPPPSWVERSRVYELLAVSQFTATTSASLIRRYGPDTTYFAPLCLAWDGRAFSWLQVLGARAEDSSPPPWSDVLWKQKGSLWSWQAPWSWCDKCGFFGCHTFKDCPAPHCSRFLFRGGFSQRLSRRVRKFYGLPEKDVAPVV